MSKNKIYCVYCGIENNLEGKKCSKCKKQLDPKNTPFKDYLIDKVKDKVSGDIQENMFNLIIEYIKNHLYGFVLTCSIVFAVTSGMVSLVNKPEKYDVLNERPVIVNNIEYLGTGLTPEEILIKYADAMNAGDIKSVKGYELNTFYPEVYNNLTDKKSKDYVFLSNNELYDKSNILFKNEHSYEQSIFYGAQPKGKYDNQEFIRYLLDIVYEFPEDTGDKDNLYAFSYLVEFIKINDNYYISGTEMDEFFTDIQESIYELFEKYQGDVSKFTIDDVYDYMEEKNG